MNEAISSLLTIILGLFGLIVTGIAAIEDFLRGQLAAAGISGQTQTIILIASAVLLILAAFRLFGGILGVLITIFLILLMVHILVPGMHVPAPTPA